MEQAMPAGLAENLIDFCENRGRVYAFLARCYEREIDAEFAAEVVTCAELESDDEVLVQSFAGLKSKLVDADEDTLERFAVVFNRVFFGMGPRTAQKAFPYESVYTSEGGLMMQDAYSEVLHVYRAAGFEKSADFSEPEDHVAVELTYLAALCERAAQALRAGDVDDAEVTLRAQATFVEEHLLNWIDRFAAEVRSADEECFYGNLATFTEAFLRADAQVLAEVVE